MHDVQAVKFFFAFPLPLLLILMDSTIPLIDHSDLSNECDPVDLFEEFPAADIIGWQLGGST